MKKTTGRILKLVSVLLAIVFMFTALPSIASAVVSAEDSQWAAELYSIATSNHASTLWDTKVVTIASKYPSEMSMLNADAESIGTTASALGSDASRLITMYAIAATSVNAIGSSEYSAKVTAAYEAQNVLELMNLYAEMIPMRKYASLKSLYDFANAYIVVRNKAMGGSHYAYTEALSDDKNIPHGSEVNFFPGSQLVLLGLVENGTGIDTREEVLLDCPDGVIRDPDVSTDGKRVLFSMKKDGSDDYHLYEMDLATRAIRQLTSGNGVSETEASYLPNGKIVFQSSRCVQTVDCWKTPVSNLYICDGDGGNIIRVGYDQVTTSYTSVTSDGRVIYTRWDYNDRTQMFVQGLFQMNADGTNQTELYGNNSSFPTTLLHTRQVTGSTTKYASIASGHHTYQGGKLVIIDVSKGRDSKDAVTYPFPEDGETYADNVDTQNQNGAIYRYPYPISETQFLVSYSQSGWASNRSQTPFDIYYMDTNGTKVLLLKGTPSLPAGQIVPIKNRDLFNRASSVNYAKSTGTYYIGNVYEGEAVKGVKFGTAKYLRIVALDYRSGAIGTNNNHNGAINGSGTAYTPVSTANGTWDVKVPLGIVKIEDDGSCLFEAPSEVSLYFQVLDENYELIATMRSWSTLQPNEFYSCVGCHEDNNTAPPAASTLAMSARQQIVPEDWMTAEAGYKEYNPYTDRIGFAYSAVVQPILDRSCVSCHDNESVSKTLINGSLSYSKATDEEAIKSYSAAYTANELSSMGGYEVVLDINADNWSYTFSKPSGEWYLPNYAIDSWKKGKAAFSNSGNGTKWDGNDMDIWIARDFTVSGSQAGKKVLLRMFNDEDVEIYINGEKVYAAAGYVTQYKFYDIEALKLKQGTNRIAIHCTQTTGGRKIDCGVYVSKTENASSKASTVSSGLFALTGTMIHGNSENRDFALSYLVLTQTKLSGSEWKGVAANGWTNWISSQSPCEVQKPYSVGSSKSYLIELLQNGHGNLTSSEIHAIECWIDLAVPYAGDYAESVTWTDSQKSYYEATQAKRKKYDELDRQTKNAIAGIS